MNISCVMSVYNEELWMIQRAIDSMLSQTIAPEEIIVVVDNPQYNDAINMLRNKYANQVTVYVNPENRGLAYSLNFGIEKSHGQLICRMDADDEALPDRIEASLNLMNEKQLDMVTTAVVLVDEKGNALNQTRIYPCSEQAIRRLSRYAACLFHPTWLFKKQVWDRIFKYREAMKYAQDYDFAMRMLQAGFRIATVSTPQLRYTVRSQSISVKSTAQQAFLGLYAQNNVYRKKPFNDKIAQEISAGHNQDFNVFQKSFDRFNQSSNAKEKIIALLAGSIKSGFFRRYVFNAVMHKAWKQYYLLYESTVKNIK